MFASVNHALADYLDPGFNCQKISGYSTGYDTARILRAVQTWQQAPLLAPDFLSPYQKPQLIDRLRTILVEINAFFDYQPRELSDIPLLSPWRIATLTMKRVVNKLTRR